MKKFVVKGKFPASEGYRKFSKEVTAASKASAEHKIKSIFGSNYNLKRNVIQVNSIEEVA